MSVDCSVRAINGGTYWSQPCGKGQFVSVTIIIVRPLKVGLQRGAAALKCFFRHSDFFVFISIDHF